MNNDSVRNKVDNRDKRVRCNKVNNTEGIWFHNKRISIVNREISYPPHKGDTYDICKLIDDRNKAHYRVFRECKSAFMHSAVVVNPTPPCLVEGVLPYFEVTGQPVPVSSLGFKCPDCFIWNCSYIFNPSKMKGPFMFTLANGTETKIKQKSMIDNTVGTMKLTTQLYILPKAHIEIIIGCDNLSRVGAVIDFTSNELSLLTNRADKTVDPINKLNIGYLGSITEITGDPIMFAPVNSHIIEPKSIKRLLIHGTEHVIHKHIFDQEVTNDCIYFYIQLQSNYHNDDKVSELVTVVRHNSSQPQRLLVGETVFSIDNRLCVDFRALNTQSELPSHPLIDMDEFMGDLGHQKSNEFTTIVLKNAYLQIALLESSQE